MTQTSDKTPVETPTTLQTECKTLFEEFGDAYQKWYEEDHRATTNAEAKKFPKPDAPFAARFLDMAIKHPDEQYVVEQRT